jgi:ech hydrogenase subunit D
MLKNLKPIAPEKLLEQVAQLKYGGFRLVTLSCSELDTHTVAILYHFDRNLQLTHLRMEVPKETVVPSISHIFASAYLVETEIQDLFQIAFSNLSIDFKGTLLLEKSLRNGPFRRYTIADADAAPASDAESD